VRGRRDGWGNLTNVPSFKEKHYFFEKRKKGNYLGLSLTFS
jgi:hypothetical protein